MVTRTIGLIVFAAALMALSGCPDKLPHDGLDCQIRTMPGGWRVARAGKVLIDLAPRGKDLHPVKAVEKDDVLYVRWSDGWVQKFTDPAPSSYEEWKRVHRRSD